MKKTVKSDVVIEAKAELVGKLDPANKPWWLRLPGKDPDTKDEDEFGF